ncbi:MAG TPA: hypothetical protein VGK54_03330 [Chloroflexota bacterium]
MAWILLGQGASVLIETTLLWRWLPAAAVPDGALILTVLWGAFRGWAPGLIAGLAAGLMTSWVSAAPLGVPLVVFGAVGACAGFVAAHFHRGSPWVIGGMMVGSTVLAFALTILALQAAGWPLAVNRQFLIELGARTVLNTILALAATPLVSALAPAPGVVSPVVGARA